MNQHKINAIFQRFARANPHPTTELHYNSVFELLIAVILSAQATDISVNKATTKLFAVANTPEQILQLGIKQLTDHVKAIGLYNTKTKNILATCKILIDQHDGQVPSTRAALEALPGVGRKTANVILNTAFNQPEIAVDTHIFRVANRTKLATGINVAAVERQLQQVIPQQYKQQAHHWLVLHGRYVCTARKPKCPTCLINDLCEFENKNLA